MSSRKPSGNYWQCNAFLKHDQLASLFIIFLLLHAHFYITVFSESVCFKTFTIYILHPHRHDRPFTVSMANCGAGTNGSQVKILLLCAFKRFQ